MKKLLAATTFALVLVTNSAHAFFFFFLPGAVTSKISDAFTGSEGENCVAATAKVGDRIRLPNGDIKIIKSLSGTSTRCTNSEMPIRAALEASKVPISTFASKASMEFPDGWTVKALTDANKQLGVFLAADNATTDSHILASGMSRAAITDLKTFAKTTRNNHLAALTSSTATDLDIFTVAGIQGWQYTISGIAKNGFNTTFNVRFYDAKDEILRLTMWTGTNNFDVHKSAFESIALSVKGIEPYPSVEVANVDLPAPNVPKSIATVAQTNSVAKSEASASAVERNVTKNDQSSAQKLRELNGLLKDGVITQKDFDSKKAEIIKAM